MAITVDAGSTVAWSPAVSDPDDDPLTCALGSTEPTKGTARLTSCALDAGSYTANSGTSGTDQFTYTVSDGRGGSATGTVNVTINTVSEPPPPSGTMRVANIGTSSTNNGSNWTAHATPTVLDSTNAPVANATISWSWSNGASGSGSCTTNSSGQCTESVGGIPKRTGSVTFNVTTVTHTTLTYTTSGGQTAVTISKP